jgi:hypothetical protein
MNSYRERELLEVQLSGEPFEEHLMAARRKTSRTRRSGTSTRGKRKSSRRTLIAPKGDKRYVRRDPKGRIKESDDQSRSLSRDRRRTAKRKTRSGQGDRGDR